ncbi:hypothetical protein ABK040_011771 [Willaertia magna]
MIHKKSFILFDEKIWKDFCLQNNLFFLQQFNFLKFNLQNNLQNNENFLQNNLQNKNIENYILILQKILIEFFNKINISKNLNILKFQKYTLQKCQHYTNWNLLNFTKNNFTQIIIDKFTKNNFTKNVTNTTTIIDKEILKIKKINKLKIYLLQNDDNFLQKLNDLYLQKKSLQNNFINFINPKKEMTNIEILKCFLENELTYLEIINLIDFIKIENNFEIYNLFKKEKKFIKNLIFTLQKECDIITQHLEDILQQL